MKRVAGTIAVLVAFVGVAIAGVHTVQAAKEADTVITDRQIALIRSRCSDIQATLNRIHERDKVLRVNKGYLYKAIILDKLMTPLNQRIATNQIDGGNLVTLTANYNQAFEKFDAAYSLYERSLSAALKIDCTKQPTTFYDQVLVAYKDRQALEAIDAELVRLSGEFKKETVTVFAAINKVEEAKQ